MCTKCPKTNYTLVTSYTIPTLRQTQNYHQECSDIPRKDSSYKNKYQPCTMNNGVTEPANILTFLPIKIQRFLLASFKRGEEHCHKTSLNYDDRYPVHSVLQSSRNYIFIFATVITLHLTSLTYSSQFIMYYLASHVNPLKPRLF